MSTEAVFGTLFGYLILGELLTPQQFFGCAMIMAAMVLAQIKPSKALDLKPIL
jgi:drug/metabolite transporter (DMT)-like permease